LEYNRDTIKNQNLSFVVAKQITTKKNEELLNRQLYRFQSKTKTIFEGSYEGFYTSKLHIHQSKKTLKKDI